MHAKDGLAHELHRSIGRKITQPGIFRNGHERMQREGGSGGSGRGHDSAVSAADSEYKNGGSRQRSRMQVLIRQYRPVPATGSVSRAVTSVSAPHWSRRAAKHRRTTQKQASNIRYNDANCQPNTAQLSGTCVARTE